MVARSDIDDFVQAVRIESMTHHVTQLTVKIYIIVLQDLILSQMWL